MPAFTMVRFKEPAIKELYERVYEKTKIKMKGYVAVQRKLLCLMYTLWKTDQVYDPKRNGVHSREEEPGGLLSGKISTIDTLEKTETSQKKSSPSVKRATRDGLSGKLSPVGPLSGKQKYWKNLIHKFIF